MLDTRFPRPPGDVGHPGSFGVPVRHRIVSGVGPDKVVADAAALRASGLLNTFCASAVELEREGVKAITTSCGFLVLLQRELQAAVAVPLVSSSLLQLPELLDRQRRIGVLTISAAHLGEEHLLAAGVPRERLGDVLLQGVDPAGEFAGSILSDRPSMDFEKARADVVAAAASLKARAPDLRTVVLECTNMPPYAQAIREATGLEPRSLLDARVLLAPFGR